MNKALPIGGGNSRQALETGASVLAVDDRPDNLMLIEDILEDEGYDVRLATDGEEALEEVAKRPPDCIVLDIMMPRLDGFETCRRIKENRDSHFIPIVMLTALTSVDDKVRAFELGADDFLNKPINVLEVTARVRSMIRIKRLRDELDSSENIILAMIEALESLNPNAAGHSRRVAAATLRVAHRLGLAQERIELAGRGAILHDIGKIGLPGQYASVDFDDPVRRSSDFLSHTQIGERILAPFISFSKVRALVRHHHERLDGSGYPDGIAGVDFDVETEILALADSWDVLRSSGRPCEEAAAELRSAADRGHYHKGLVETLIEEVGAADFGTTDWQALMPFPAHDGPGKILVGYGAPATREALHRILTGAGHEVIGMSDGGGVEEAIQRQKPDLVLLDIDLPNRSGIDLSRAIKGRPETEFLPIILVTAQNDLTTRHLGTRAGADDFLFLPINRMELTARVKSLLRLRTFFKDLEEHQSVILSLASALEARDTYTRGHSERVGVLAAKLGRSIGLAEDECEALRTAGHIHDIGKIGLDENLINKQGQLTPEEFEIVKEHPLSSERICQPLRTMQHILPIARHHHERFDGTGYPDGLRGEEIPLGARILGLVDAYDALTSSRAYRGTYSAGDAIQLLEEETRSGLWDPSAFSALAALVRLG